MTSSRGDPIAAPHVGELHGGCQAPDDGGRVLVLEEPLRDVMIRDDEQDIRNYQEAFGVLRELALDEAKSLQFIRNLIADAKTNMS